MNDPFGVHKSYVSPGAGVKGFVAAKDLTPGMKNLIRTRAKAKEFHSGNNPGKKVKGQSAKGRTVYDTETRSMNRKISTDILPEAPSKNLRPTGEVLLGNSQPNGRGGGLLRMNAKATKDQQDRTYRHELAHLAPKRNPARLGERLSNPKRLGREEGRADFIGNKGERTPGSYPGSKDFQRGYNEVQNKMHRNRKPRKFAVNQKGEAIQKSAFGIVH